VVKLGVIEKFVRLIPENVVIVLFAGNNNWKDADGGGSVPVAVGVHAVFISIVNSGN
jgi:hypothetical protein